MSQSASQSGSADHPIKLESVFFTKVVVIAMPEHDPSAGEPVPPPINAIDVVRDAAEEGLWRAGMRTVINAEMDKRGPYSIEVMCSAILRASKDLDENEAKRGVTITAHSVLYGAIREQIAWLTARQPFGPLVLGLSILRGADSVPPNPEPSSTAIPTN